MIKSVKEVLRRRGRGWQVISEDQVLREFLEPYGDYNLVINEPWAFDERSEANIIAWRPRGKAIVLSWGDTDRGPECAIDKAVLIEVIDLLAKSRSRHARKRPSKLVRVRAARRSRR